MGPSEREGVETARLVGRPVAISDLDEYRVLLQDPGASATLAGPRTDAQVDQILADSVDHWAMHGFGMWTWRAPDTGEFVARGGLRYVPDLVLGEKVVEVGYALMPGWWRQGHGSDIARRSVRFAFEETDVPALVSFTLPTNAGSRGVMQNAGFTYDQDFVYKGLPHVLYRQARPRP